MAHSCFLEKKVVMVSSCSCHCAYCWMNHSYEVEVAVGELVSVEEAVVEFDSELNYQDKVTLSSVTYSKDSNAGNEVDHTMGQQCYWTRHRAHSQSQRPSVVFHQMT